MDITTAPKEAHLGVGDQQLGEELLLARGGAQDGVHVELLHTVVLPKPSAGQSARTSVPETSGHWLWGSAALLERVPHTGKPAPSTPIPRKCPKPARHPQTP